MQATKRKASRRIRRSTGNLHEVTEALVRVVRSAQNRCAIRRLKNDPLCRNPAAQEIICACHVSLNCMARVPYSRLSCSCCSSAAFFQFADRSAAQAPSEINPQPSPSVTPQTQSIKPALQCSGCHGAGKTLPYLGGAQFHATPHTEYERSFHALSKKNGAKSAKCLDCHERDGNLTSPPSRRSAVADHTREHC